MDELQEQPKNNAEHLKPYQFKKGVSGNPMGRPPGSSLKERAKKYLAGLTDEEAVEFFEGMDKKDVWEMAEGKASTNTDITSKGEKITFVPAELLDKHAITSEHPSSGTEPNSEGQA